MSSSYSWNTISHCARELTVVDIIFTVIDFTAIGLRFWSGRISGRKFRWDDAFVIFALLWSLALGFTGLYGGWALGLGFHIIDIKPVLLLTLVKLFVAQEFIYVLGVTSCKLSMLCLFLRIYTTPTFRKWVFFTIGLCAAYVVALIPVFLTNCIPLSQYWDPKPDGWCRDPVISDSATVAGNLVLDAFVLLLPLPILWRLQMSIRDKITVTSMFSIGLVTVALTIWRQVVTTDERSSTDWPFTLCSVGIIAALEIHLGILCVSIPTYGPLFNAYVKPFFRRIGLVSTAPDSRPTGKKLYLATFGSSGKKGRSGGYSEFTDSVDRIVSRDNSSIRLVPMGEGKVVSECTFKPLNEMDAPEERREGFQTQRNVGGGIHVQRDVEAQYHARNNRHLKE